MTPVRVDVAVIGAGVAGATAAAALSDAGASVMVVEKGRGPGGRAASRRGNLARHDHGAQYFTARDPGFRDVLARAPMRTQLARWSPRLGAWDGKAFSGAAPKERFVGVPGMNALVRGLLGDLEPCCRTEVVRLEPAGSGWQLFGSDGQPLVVADALVVTAPPLQSAALIGSLAAPLGRLCEQVQMLPCWAVMATFGDALPFDFDALFVNAGPLSWCADNASKPGRSAVTAWTLHATPDWSNEHIDAAPEWVRQRLMAALATIVGAPLPALLAISVHRWRFALAAQSLHCGAAWHPRSRIGIAGDWLAGSRIEGAWVSGREVARRMLAG